MNVLVNIMIVDATQLQHFKTVLGVTNCDNGILEQHATFDIVNSQKQARAIRDIDHVHLIVFIKLKELHHVALMTPS
jgi:hypothetical protein